MAKKGQTQTNGNDNVEPIRKAPQLALLMLSPDECQVLINLINIAVKERGLEAAESGIHFSRKITAAAQEAQKRLAAAG